MANLRSPMKELAMRTRRSSSCRVVGLFLLAAGLASPAVAQGALRTWVSGFGNDLNPCSFSAPCRTFQTAISNTAPGGEVDARDPGDYGSFVITQAITIDGGPGITTVSPTNPGWSIRIAAGSSDVVVLRNLSVNGSHFGIVGEGVSVLGGRAVMIDHCQIFGFDIGIRFQPLGGMNLTVTDTSVYDNGIAGIFTITNGAFFARLSATRVRLDGNGDGMVVEDNSLVFVKDSTASHNTGSGFIAISTFGGAAQLDLENASSSNNGNAGVVSINPGAVTTVDNASIDHNVGAGLVPLGGGLITSFGNNKVVGNAGGPGSVSGSAFVM